MRKIKFRAWDKKNRRMLVGFNCIHFLKTGKILGIFDLSGNRVFEYHKDIELMQFTNLKDKKGKEIFEGDIILIVTGSLFFKRRRKEEVEFGEGCFMANGENLSNWIDREIIGNKFENPELLE